MAGDLLTRYPISILGGNRQRETPQRLVFLNVLDHVSGTAGPATGKSRLGLPSGSCLLVSFRGKKNKGALIFPYVLKDPSKFLWIFCLYCFEANPSFPLHLITFGLDISGAGGAGRVSKQLCFIPLFLKVMTKALLAVFAGKKWDNSEVCKMRFVYGD